MTQEKNSADTSDVYSPLWKYQDELYSIAYDNPDPASATSGTIVTALDSFTVTQAQSGAPAGAVQLAQGLDWTIYADRLVIYGQLSFPGKQVTVVARTLAVQAAGADPAAISVDGQTPPGVTTPADWPNLPASADGHQYELNGIVGGKGKKGATGSTGQPGSSAGQIALWVGEFSPGTSLTLSACGGAGQDGEAGQNGQNAGAGGAGMPGSFQNSPGNGADGGLGGVGGPGGPAGAGGNGGTVSVQYTAAPAAISISVGGGAGGAGGKGGNGGIGGHGGNGGDMPIGHDGDGGSGGNGGSAQNGGAAGFGGAAGTVTITGPTCSISLNANGGSPGAMGSSGTYGAGGEAATVTSDDYTPKHGVHGSPGTHGQAGQIGNSSAPKISVDPDDSVFAQQVSAAQCSMTLAKAKLLYLSADPKSNPSAYGEAEAMLVWLQTMLQYSNEGSWASASGLSQSDIESMKAVYSSATGYLFQLSQGRDFFGHAPEYVPRGSYTLYHSTLKQLLGDSGTFTVIETTYEQYFEALQKQESAADALTDAQSQATDQQNALRSQYTSLFDDAQSAADLIPQDETAMSKQYDVMTAAIGDAIGTIGSVAGLNCMLNNLLGGLKMVATVKGDGPYKKTSAILGQIYGAGSSAVSTLSGTKNLPTENLVWKVVALADKVTLQSLQEGYTANSGLITEADPDAAKLLAAQSAFDTAIQPYADWAGVHNAEDQLQQYVTTVQKRNADVLAYNSAISQITNLQAQINQAANQVSQLQIATEQSEDPGLPSLVAAMVHLYHQARAAVIQQIYLASRSYSFWSLVSEGSGFTAFIGLSNPSDINSYSLNNAFQGLLTQFAAAIETFDAAPQSFLPTSHTMSGPGGITLSISKKHHPGLIDSLTTADADGNYQLAVTLPAARVETPESLSPFFDKANVRICTVRAWVRGATTKSKFLTVNIVHTGPETIVTPENKTHYFTHAPITRTFEFIADHKKWTDDGAIMMDGNFDSGTSDANNSDYALPGPFTVWQILIQPRYNTDLDMTKVDKITLEFWGTAYPFKVPVQAPIISSFDAIWAANESQLQLSWATEHATSVELTDAADPVTSSGTYTITPSESSPVASQYTLTANSGTMTTSMTLGVTTLQALGSPIPIDGFLGQVALSPDGSRVFATNSTFSTLMVFDSQTLKPVSGSPFNLVDSTTGSPNSIAVSADGSCLFVADSTLNELIVVDSLTFEPVSGSPVAVGSHPEIVAVSPDGSRVYVCSYNNTVTVLDATTLQPVTGSPLKVEAPNSIAISQTQVFVATEVTSISVFDAESLEPVTGSPIAVTNLQGIAVSPDGKLLFVSNGSSSLQVLDCATLQPVSRSPAQVGVNALEVAVSPDGSRVYVIGDGELAVIGADTLAVTGPTVSIASGPLVVPSSDGTRILLASRDDKTVAWLQPTFTEEPSGG